MPRPEPLGSALVHRRRGLLLRPGRNAAFTLAPFTQLLKSRIATLADRAHRIGRSDRSAKGTNLR
jgi:hypothetical protein